MDVGGARGLSIAVATRKIARLPGVIMSPMAFKTLISSARCTALKLIDEERL